MSEPILGAHALTKDFGGLRAVDGLDLAVDRGEVFGFLGPNGAGKTTFIRLILGLIHPTSGHAEIAGHRIPGDRQEAARHVGGFVDDPTFYGGMSARRNLRLLASMSGPVSAARIDDVLDMVGLAARGDSKVGSFSHGMKQRLGIAQALIHRPDLIVLDEPTSGLDPRGMKEVRELIRELGAGGTTVFLSSHLLHEVEQVCTRAAIINRGKVVVQGPVSDLRPKGEVIKVLTSDQAKAAEILRTMFGKSAAAGPQAIRPGASAGATEAPAATVAEDEGYLVVSAGDEAVPELVRRLVAGDLDVRAVVPAGEQGLEDYFLELTARDEDEAPRAPKRRGLLRRRG